MWTGHGKCLRKSDQRAEETEREHGSTKESNEFEKAQLVSQEKDLGIKTADETISMINQIQFFLLRCGIDCLSPCLVSYKEVRTLTDACAESIWCATLESQVQSLTHFFYRFLKSTP
jgi:hypothetical protein